MAMAEESKPLPDPTILTTAQLLRETEALRRDLAGMEQLLLAKIDSNEKVCKERFNSVDTQFQLVERQRVEQKKDTSDAVAAALAAAKEAVKEQTTASERSIAKSEASTAEQLKQQSTTFSTAIQGSNVNHEDLKERVGKIENLKQGGGDALKAIIALAGFVLTLLLIGSVVAAIIAAQSS